MAESSNYAFVIKQLGKVDPALKKAVAKKMRAMVAESVSEARSAASWSRTIPGAIGPTVTAKGVGIRVNVKKSRIAVLNEGKGWRHPLFGDTDHWYAQTARPSVKPVIDRDRAKLAAAGAEIIAEAVKEAGF